MSEPRHDGGPVASVVLCVRNGGADLDHQLDALSDLEVDASWELVVVDNGSTDDSMARVAKYVDRIPSVRIIPAFDRAGLAHARNVGAAAAHGEILAFCDADDVVHPDWLTELLSATGDRQIAGGALDLTVLNQADVIYWRGWAPRLEELPLGLGHLPHVIGASFSVHRDDYLSLGGCDETFTTSSDELDLCWRAQGAGMAIVFAERAVTDYRLRADLRSTARQQINYGKSAVALYAKHHDSMPRRTIGEIVWPYWHLTSRVHQLVRGRRLRGRWISNAAYRWGRLQGSAASRVWYP